MISPLVVDQRGEEERRCSCSAQQGATYFCKRGVVRGAENTQIMVLNLKQRDEVP